MGRSTARRRPTRQISRARRTMSRQRWISRWQANLFPRRKPNHTGARSSINPRSFAAAVADRSRSAVTDAGYKFSTRRSNTTAAFVYIQDRQLLQRGELQPGDERHLTESTRKMIALGWTERFSLSVAKVATTSARSALVLFEPETSQASLRTQE